MAAQDSRAVSRGAEVNVGRRRPLGGDEANRRGRFGMGDVRPGRPFADGELSHSGCFGMGDVHRNGWIVADATHPCGVR